MKSFRLCLLLLVLAFVMAPQLAFSQAAPAPQPAAAASMPDYAAFEAFLESQHLATEMATKPEGPKGHGSNMRTTGRQGALMCDWFVIECYGGGGDECCGSVSSCLVYCEQLCGGPCEYIP